MQEGGDRNDRGLPRHRFSVPVFLPPERDCPYLPDRMERVAVTPLDGLDADRFYSFLSRLGFRRSHGLAYLPRCEGCSACVAIRVVARHHQPSRSQRRVIRRNADLSAELKPSCSTDEQYELFCRYLRTRHGDGEMAKMDRGAFAAMIEKSPIDTGVIEFRDPTGKLVGATLFDHMDDGLSAVYSFFDPDESSRSLGTFMVLALIDQTVASARHYLYLGYWIEERENMAYKSRFAPVEVLGHKGWQLLTRAGRAGA
jgi:leucyl-tRNA---protein transferase